MKNGSGTFQQRWHTVIYLYIYIYIYIYIYVTKAISDRHNTFKSVETDLKATKFSDASCNLYQSIYKN